MNTSDFVKKARETHDAHYIYLKSVYSTAKSPLIIICPTHGEFNQKPGYHLKGSGCPKCNKFRSKAEDLRKLCKRKRPDLNFDDTTIVNRKSSVIVQCRKHGKYTTSVRQILKGSNCLRCNAEDRKVSLPTIIQEARKYGYSLLDSNYINNKTPMQFRCKNDHIFFVSYQDLKKGHGCGECKGYKRYSKEELSKILEPMVEGSVSFNDYKNLHSTITVDCNKCGNVYENLGRNLIKGHGCPRCSQSKEQKGLSEFVSSLGLEFIENDRDAIEPQELDIYVPDHALAVEMNGIYWHSLGSNRDGSKKTGLHSKYHQSKLLRCSDVGISLLQFTDHEWSTKRNIVKSIIKNKFGLSSTIYARKCEKSTQVDVAEFFHNNHLHGHRSSSVNYTLSYGDKIVAAMSFSRHSKYEWELMRHCNIINTTVVGGLSRLFKAFLRDYSPNSVFSYADASFSNSFAYDSIGFRNVGLTDPGYFYWKNNKIFSRQRFQKHKLSKKLANFNPDLTEHQNMFLNGYRQYWNAGNYKFLWVKS